MDPITFQNVDELKKIEKDLDPKQPLLFTCPVCGKLVSRKLYRLQYTNYNLLCKSCSYKDKVKGDRLKQQQEKRKQTCLEKYGVENPGSAKQFIEKRQQTCLKRYGETSFSKTDDFQKKVKKTWESKTPEEIQEIVDKNKQTCLERYGNENVNLLPEFREKRKQTCLDRYGVDCVLKADLQKKKARFTLLKKYGVDNITKTDFRQAAIKKYWSNKTSKRYKTHCKRISIGRKRAWARVDPEYKKQFIQKFVSIRYIFGDQSFDSSWELALWIYAKDHSEEIEREPLVLEYTFKNHKHHYYPDFRYRDQIIELKNDHLLEKMKLENTIDNAKLKCLQQNNVIIWNLPEIQFALDYVNQKYTPDFLGLFKTKIPFPFVDKIQNVNNNYDIIRYFHKSIYTASKANHPSPFEAWQDKSLVLKSALNRLQYVGNCKPSMVVRGFSVTRIAPKVSVFRPNLAERLIKTYLDESETIFDPFSGFSGRLLSAASCNKKYIGQDLNEEHVKESNEIIQFKELQGCTVVQQDILTDSNKQFYNTSLFTCPPYSDKEFWTEDKSELTKTCDEWIDICLEKYKCDRYLFVVDDTERYKDKVVEHLGTQGGLFKRKSELVVLINHQ